jgi:hypothetical protein
VQFASTSSVTAPWAEPITLSDPEDGGSGLTFAFDPGGDVLAAWTGWYSSDRASGYFIQATFKPVGGQWEHPDTVSVTAKDSHGGASTASGTISVAKKKKRR